MGRGSAYGESCLGFSYLHGLGVEKNYATAFTHFQKAADEGSSDGLAMLGHCYQNGFGVEQDTYWAFSLIQESANMWDEDGQRHLADCYWNGRGVCEDKDEAENLYWKAAENGCDWAFSILLSLLLQGDLEADGKRLLRLLNHGIETGDVKCKIDLASLLLSGDGSSKDKNRGRQLLEEAAATGITRGMVQLGLYYLIEDEDKKAFRLFKRASASDLEACIYAGICLSQGLGVQQNLQDAKLFYQKGFCAEGKDEEMSFAAAFALSCETSDLFQKSILEGSERGLARLGLMYRHGRGVEKNVDEAIRLLLLAEKKGSSIAGVEMGRVYAEGDGVQQDDISAVAHFLRALRNGLMTGSAKLAESLSRGGGSVEETEEVLRLAKEASDAGNVDAHLFLAHWYAPEGVPGSEVDIDPAEGVRLTKLAADMGDSIAQRSLGVEYLVGHVVQENVEEGLRLIRASARDGYRVAQRDIGIFNVYRDYGETNLCKGVQYLRKADQQGDIGACFELGKLYMSGRGVRRDTAKAVEHFVKAANCKSEAAIVQLGLCARNGVVLEKYGRQALELFRQAADLGSADGKLLLGLCFRRGEGVMQNNAKALEMLRQSTYGSV